MPQAGRVEAEALEDRVEFEVAVATAAVAPDQVVGMYREGSQEVASNPAVAVAVV